MRSKMLMTENLIAELESIVRDRLEDWPPHWERYHWPGYTYDHTLRVRNLAVAMAAKERADTYIVELAALLHDIAKDAGDDHGAAGAVEAERILRAHGAPDDIVQRVCSAIETHTGKNTPQHPIENLVLGDADLIDANFGLVAAWRFITIRAGHQTPLADTIVSMQEWLPRKDALMEKLLTETGRWIAHERSARMHVFCVDLRAVLEGRSPADGYSLLSAARHIAESYTTGRLEAQVAEIEAAAALHPRGPTPDVGECCRFLRAEIAGTA
jgi:putative nucleotidyltransferase with HDIG domain